MKTLETHICVSPEEFAKNPVKYVVGDIKDLEKYDPPPMIKGWVKARTPLRPPRRRVLDIRSAVFNHALTGYARAAFCAESLNNSSGLRLFTGMTLQGFSHRDNYHCESVPVG